MKRFRYIVIGGIQSKIFNLILITILLLSAANAAVYLYHSRMLTQVVTESAEQQQETIGETTSAVMDAVVEQSLVRANQMEALDAEEMFTSVKGRVMLLADYAAKLFAHPERFAAAAYSGPKAEDDGKWTAKVIYAEGVDPDDPNVSSRVGLIANMSEWMISLCPAFEADDIYVALPEGAMLSVSSESSGWIENGKVIAYDPRGRSWYQQAAEAGTLIFTDGGTDANTGEFCVECAAPVYDADGNLAAVVGADLYLDEMQETLQASMIEGEYKLLINREGKSVLAPLAEAFPLDESEIGGDLRISEYEVLSRAVRSALSGEENKVQKGELADGEYYIMASPIEATGWTLAAVYSVETASRPVTLLKDQNRQIQDGATEAYRRKSKVNMLTAVVLLSLVTLLALAASLVLGKRIVKPLNTITKRISELREGNLVFRMEKAYRTGDEVEELAESFARISHKTVQYVDTVKRVTAEKERIGAELSLATRIQADMLPNIYPAFPERPEFDIYASMTPAREVGGDFYDFFLVDDDHLCMVMADVSGKGVPAALFMMASKIILANNAMLGKSPAKILEDTNAAICSNNREEMFVTVWLGILEISTGRLTAANAGHEYPAVDSGDGTFELYKDKHGFVIGGMDGMRYKEYELQLSPGSRLFVYTDGVPEATDGANELFGTDRMIEALNAEPNAEPERVLQNIRAAVDGFVKEAEQFDDLTMLCMEYKGTMNK